MDPRSSPPFNASTVPWPAEAAYSAEAAAKAGLAKAQRFNDFNAAAPTFRVRDPKILRSTSVKGQNKERKIQEHEQTKH